jgi:steroid 5-alpha reductase family enzyme
MKTLVLDAYYLGITALVTVGMQLLFFFIAYTCQFDKVTDFAGTTNFILVALLTLGLNGTYYTRQVVNTVLVCVWGLRLGAFLLVRVLKRAKDARFDEMRSNFFSFLGFWIFQMLWVWIVSLPIIFLNSSTVDVDISAADIVGWVLWGLSFLLEAVADQSKYNFGLNPENKGHFMKDGVWSISRHPNYAGEIGCWIGLFISCASVFNANTSSAYVSILSPITTFCILMFLSGVNLAEERYNRQYNTREDYFSYRESTSPLIPLPQVVYRNIPNLIKRLFCCEFRLYEKGLTDE